MREDLPGIEEIVDLLGLTRDPKGRQGDSVFYVRCPFCGGNGNKYKMRIDTNINCYCCHKCSGGEKGTGVLDLYSRVRMGTPHIKGASGNGKEILKAMLTELGRGNQPYGQNTAPRSAKKFQQKPRNVGVRVAADVTLNKAYSFLIDFPYFKLSDQHRQNLCKRGLDNVAIARNGYASVPADTAWTQNYPELIELFKREGLEKTSKEFQRLRTKSQEQLMAGFVLGSEMVKAGITLKGVPGAYQIKGYWCMMYDPGMLIPTRNRKGQIVACQTRLEKGKLRYLTLSASGLPKAVDNGVSRIHFPLANSPVVADGSVEFICTEGPLKADVIAHLYHSPVFVFALHGVSNTRELAGLFRQLRVEGVENVVNGFDMDKVLNTNVREQSKALAKKAFAAGLRMQQRCWDLDTAKRKYQELALFCEQHGVCYSHSDNIFTQLALMADALKEQNIPCCVKTVNGEEIHDYWSDATKGMDDYLLFLKNKK